MQEVVKSGEGFALLREGISLIDGLVTRPIVGVDWMVDTAMVFKREVKLKTLPVIAKSLRKEFSPSTTGGARKKGPKSTEKNESPSQLRLLG